MNPSISFFPPPPFTRSLFCVLFNLVNFVSRERTRGMARIRVNFLRLLFKEPDIGVNRHSCSLCSILSVAVVLVFDFYIGILVAWLSMFLKFNEFLLSEIAKITRTIHGELVIWNDFKIYGREQARLQCNVCKNCPDDDNR